MHIFISSIIICPKTHKKLNIPITVAVLGILYLLPPSASRTLYNRSNIQQGDKIFYLGLQLDVNFSQHSISIRQPGYIISDLHKEFPVDRASNTPAAHTLFDATGEGQPEDTSTYWYSYWSRRTPRLSLL